MGGVAGRLVSLGWRLAIKNPGAWPGLLLGAARLVLVDLLDDVVCCAR
jgi:hypothetical protein